MGASLISVPLKKGGPYKLSSKDDSMPHIEQYLLKTMGRPFEDRSEVDRFRRLSSVQRADFISARIPATSGPSKEVAAQAP